MPSMVCKPLPAGSVKGVSVGVRIGVRVGVRVEVRERVDNGLCSWQDLNSVGNIKWYTNPVRQSICSIHENNMIMRKIQ